MAKSFIIVSWGVILLTLCWGVYEYQLRHLVQWHFLAVAGVHFIMSFILNRQLTTSKYNYLGFTHGALMLIIGLYGYFFIT